MGRHIAIAAGLGIAATAVVVTTGGPAEPTSIRLSAPDSAAPRGPLVGVLFDSRGGRARLARLNAETLRVRGPTLALTEPPGPSARSADGARLAVGSTTTPYVRVVALESWRAGSRWRLGRKRVPVQALAWTGSRRLLALLAAGLTPGQVVVGDPVARRIVASRRLNGTLAAWAPSALGITVILGPRSGIGAARLVHVDARGRTVTASLPGVAAGVSGQDSDRPYGLRLVDLQRGTVRVLSRGGYAYGARGRVLAVGIGKTLRAFDAEGRRVWSRFPRGGIRDLTIGPRYAYVLVGHRTYVLDPRTGATVRVLATGRPPLLLTT